MLYITFFALCVRPTYVAASENMPAAPWQSFNYDNIIYS